MNPKTPQNSNKNSFLTAGVRLMIFATISFTIMQVFVKQLGNFHTFQITFFRSAVTSICCFIYLWKHQLPVIGNQQKILFIRAFLGIVSMTSFFFTLQWMPFGASVTLKYLSPIFAAIFAIFLLKEKIKPIQWLFFVMALSGVLLLKGFDTRINLMGLSIGILGAVAGGLIYPIIRKIGTSEHPMVIINYFMFTASVVMSLLMIPFWKSPTLIECSYLMLLGISGYYAQVFMTKAFQLEAVNIIAPMKYLEVIYALLIGFLWFGESYELISFLGILLIFLGMFLNLTFKQKTKNSRGE